MKNDKNTDEAALIDATEPLATEYVIPRYYFSVNGQNILQDKNFLSQYSVVDKIYTLPNSPPWFKGLLNQHNTILPVYSLSHFFNSEKSNFTQRQHNVLTMQIDSNKIGLLVDDTPKQVDVDLKSVEKFEQNWPEMINESITACYINKKTSWIEFSFQKLFLILASHK